MGNSDSTGAENDNSRPQRSTITAESETHTFARFTVTPRRFTQEIGSFCLRRV
jgi:hypothetical protein